MFFFMAKSTRFHYFGRVAELLTGNQYCFLLCGQLLVLFSSYDYAIAQCVRQAEIELIILSVLEMANDSPVTKFERRKTTCISKR